MSSSGKSPVHKTGTYFDEEPPFFTKVFVNVGSFITATAIVVFSGIPPMGIIAVCALGSYLRWQIA